MTVFVLAGDRLEAEMMHLKRFFGCDFVVSVQLIQFHVICLPKVDSVQYDKMIFNSVMQLSLIIDCLLTVYIYQRFDQ